jgi:hypothetical protein
MKQHQRDIGVLLANPGVRLGDEPTSASGGVVGGIDGVQITLPLPSAKVSRVKRKASMPKLSTNTRHQGKWSRIKK